MIKYMSSDSYAQSTLLKKLITRKNQNLPLRIAFLDIDSTMTGSYPTTNATRKRLEKLGYAIVFVTARTEEMLMSSRQYNLSLKLGFDRPLPKLGKMAEKYSYIPPEKVEAEGLLNPDIIAGTTGTQILVKQENGGFMPDTEFENKFATTPSEWRQRIMDLINDFNNEKKKAYLASFETPENYTVGICNIYQPKFRINILFQSAKDKIAFRSFIRQYIKLKVKDINLRISDDSEPEKDLHILQLTPKSGGKRKAVDNVIQNIINITKVKPSDLHVLMAGDGHSDFDMGMRAANGTCITFLLAGGSRLMPALTCTDHHPKLMDDELENLKTLLYAQDKKGYYSNRLSLSRNLIICDEAISGKKSVESILLYLEKLN